MNIHEYQAKALLSSYNIKIPKGEIAFTADEAAQVARDLGGKIWVVKSQIHAGGRGAGKFANNPNGQGGVRIARSNKEVKAHAAEMLGQVLVTKQTGPEGKKVKQVYIEEGCNISRELYLSILIDRSNSKITMIASTEGGMDIETVAKKSPEKILTLPIDVVSGLKPFHSRKIAYLLDIPENMIKNASSMMSNLYKVFTDLDASLIEINPLVITDDDEIIVLDAKMNFDDNALYRQPSITSIRDEDEEDPMELEASKHDLNYIKLDGSIGCMVNGAGLAMATMDIIKLYGGQPANFLDVGGSADKERVTIAFKIILSDPNVEGIMVNIFGGIMRCDVIAEGVIAAALEVELNVPLVVRLEGTNVELGKQILIDSGLPIVSADNLADAARKIVNEVAKAS
jgi:succinyl-CoA synthetase beta subunit